MSTLRFAKSKLGLLCLSLLLGASAACSEAATDTSGYNGDGDAPSGDGDKPSGDGDGDSSNGDGDVSNGDGDSAAALPLIPWAVGNSWTYRVTKNGVTTIKVTTVGPEEPVGGTGPNKDKLANKVTTKKGAEDETVSWQTVIGNLHVRYRELGYGATSKEVKLEEHWDPYKVRVDNSPERRKLSASWLDVYQETKAPMGLPVTTTESRDTWFIDGVDQTVTVPAGTFKAIVIQKTGTGSKTYWYVPGVGKVKETGGQTEELESYNLVGQ